MPRWSILLLGILIVPAMYACGGASTPSSASSDETCPVTDPGPPAVCPAGCLWSGTACKRTRGVIIDFEKADGGPPPPPASTE